MTFLDVNVMTSEDEVGNLTPGNLLSPELQLFILSWMVISLRGHYGWILKKN